MGICLKLDNRFNQINRGRRSMCRPTTMLITMGFFLSLIAKSTAQQPHFCSADALKRAPILLKHHLQDDLLGSEGHGFKIGKQIRHLAPIVNPAASHQKFDVLQTWAFVYKAKYRLRFYYAQLPETCALMGQEVFEHAKL